MATDIVLNQTWITPFEKYYTESSLNDHEGNEQTVPWNLTEEERSFAQLNNIVYYSILFPVAFCGNVFTLTAVFMVLKIKKSVPNMLIGVLAFADLTSILTCHVFSLISMTQQRWIGGPVLCQLQSVMAFTYFKLGFFSKICISIDRFIALRFPLKYRSVVTTKRVMGMIVFNVLFSIGSSGLTWIVDGEYIAELETWYMCTNEFNEYTAYKLAIVISEGTVFLIGVVIFFVGNITVMKVMLKLSDKMKKLKANNGSLSRLKMKPLTIVTSVSAGFTDIGAIAEVEEKNNNDQDDDEDSEKEIPGTPCTKYAVRKMNSNGSVKKEENSATNGNGNGISSNSRNDLTVSYQKETSLYPNRRSLNLEINSSPETRRNLRSSLPSNGINGKRKSIFKKMLSSKTLTNKKQNRQRKELQFAKLMIAIVTVFVILWIPYMFTIYYEHSNRKRLHPLILDISMKLVFANACINPILYGVFNANFRKAYVYYLKMVFYYLTCKKTARPDGKNMPWSLVIRHQSIYSTAYSSRMSKVTA